MIRIYWDSFREKYYRLRGQRFLTRGKLSKADHYFQKALIINQNAPNYYNMAILEMGNNHFQEALSYLHKVLELVPDNDMAVLTCAECYAMLREWDESIFYFRTLNNKYPSHSLYKYYYERSMDVVQREKYVRSRELFNQAMLETEKKEYEKAYQSLLEAEEYDPLNPMIPNNLGGISILAGKPLSEVVVHFEQAVKIAPNDEKYKKNLLYIKRKMLKLK